jgi:BspA type Leucine rich repeat region (6 copies)
VTVIGDSAFTRCRALRRVRLPNSVTKIGTGVFRDCTSLEGIEIPPGVTVIEDMTFCTCKSLESIHIPANVEEIKYKAFYECESLRSVTFAPDGECSLERLGKSFIGNSKTLRTFSLPPSVTYMSDHAFDSLSARVLLPWGRFEDAPSNSPGILTMAFMLLQHARKRCNVPIEIMHKTPTVANLVNLLTELVASRATHPQHQCESSSSERILTQAILLIVETFPEVLFGNGGGERVTYRR